MLVDEHEVNRNNEYYCPIFKTFDNKGKPDVAFITVSTKISRGYDSCTQFLEKIGPIYKDFTKSVNYYDQDKDPFSVLFHFGYIIFNKKALD